MKTVTSTELRSNIYALLEEVLNTGIPLEVNKGGRKLKITPVEPMSKLDRLIARPHVIIGDPEELVGLSWEDEVQLDLP